MSEIKLPPGDGAPAPKSPWKSKTLWANFAAILTNVGLILSGEVTLSAGVVVIFPILLATVNIFLRFRTTEPLGTTPK